MIVLKWEVPVDGSSHRIGPGKVVHVGCQYGNANKVIVWTEEQDTESAYGTNRYVRVFATGETIPLFPIKHLGSAIEGIFVWHVYEVKAPVVSEAEVSG